MKVSQKIGLSFILTFVLVIALGGLSIYTLRGTYKGLQEALTKDIPASQNLADIVTNTAEALIALDNYLLTTDDHYRARFEEYYSQAGESIDIFYDYALSSTEKDFLEAIQDAYMKIHQKAKEG